MVRMAASLPYPALHATHGGIWIAAPDGAVRGGRPRRGDRARGRDADDHAQRAAGRQPARLSRSVRARPARAVRLRPSGALRGADAEGPRPRARPRRAGERRRGGAASCARRPAALLATLEGDWPEREGAWASAQALDRLRWPWAPRGRRSGCAGPSATSAGCSRRLPEWEESGAPAAAARRSRLDLGRDVGRGSTAWSATAPRRAQGQRDYAAAAAAVFAPRARRGPAQPAARRGRHRDRQDAGLSRPRLALGRAGRRRGLGLDLHQGAAAPARPRGRAALPRRRRSARRKIVIRKGRENYLCLLNLEDALQGGFAGRAAILAQLVARWAAYTQGRRHGRRRPAGLADDAVPPRRRDRADRPARRMRLCRLPALPELLHRARGARQRTRPTSSSPTTRW